MSQDPPPVRDTPTLTDLDEELPAPSSPPALSDANPPSPPLARVSGEFEYIEVSGAEAAFQPLDAAEEAVKEEPPAPAEEPEVILPAPAAKEKKDVKEKKGAKEKKARKGAEGKGPSKKESKKSSKKDNKKTKKPKKHKAAEEKLQKATERLERAEAQLAKARERLVKARERLARFEA